MIILLPKVLTSSCFHKVAFSSDPPLFFTISVTTALTKTLTYPCTLGGHTLKAAARFMTYPKL